MDRRYLEDQQWESAAQSTSGQKELQRPPRSWDVFQTDKTDRHMRELWRPEEDELLKATVTARGAQNWQDIADAVNRYVSKEGRKWRSPKSCRQRWNEHLNPALRLDPLTEVEKQAIVELQQKFGNQWTVIAQELGNRSPNTVKNFWYNYHRKSRGLDPTASVSISDGQSTDGGSSDPGHSRGEQQGVRTNIKGDQDEDHLKASTAGNYAQYLNMPMHVPLPNIQNAYLTALSQVGQNPMGMGLYPGTDRGLPRAHAPHPQPSPLGAHHPQEFAPSVILHTQASSSHSYRQHDGVGEERTMELFGKSVVPQNPYQPR